ncbi:MAG: hypothetical protein WBQ95_19710 [Terracidiphilus sp.]
MRKKWWMFLLIPPFIVLCGWIFGEIVMNLWNWLLPPLFGWHQVGFWQALGLLVLCRILFGGFRNGAPRGSRPKRRSAEQWEKMTPEERERFRQSWWSRCGAMPVAGNESKESV